MADLKFSVSGENVNPTKFIAKSRQFTFTIDEPEGLGGTDHGANPVEFLLAAYAGCLNVMGHIVARELGIGLKSIRIEAEGDLNPAKVFGHETEDRPGYKQIRVNIFPESDAGEEKLARWLEIIESRCPVNDNLLNPTPVSISLKKAIVTAA